MYKHSKLIPTKLPQSNESNVISIAKPLIFISLFLYLLEISNEAG